VRRRSLSLLTCGALAATALAVGTPAAQAADGCGTTGAHTVKSTGIYGRTIELRATSNQACAWGRISYGSVGDLVWVDRSYDGGRSWTQLSVTRINTGRDAFTEPWNDVNKVMRACGKAGNRSEVACTVWW
jgi:hypothetical protein